MDVSGNSLENLEQKIKDVVLGGVSCSEKNGLDVNKDKKNILHQKWKPQPKRCV